MNLSLNRDWIELENESVFQTLDVHLFGINGFILGS